MPQPLEFKFAIASDLHIALPHTIWDHPSRFHLVELSIDAFEVVLTHLAELNLDFLLLPGDLTQHGEPDNHEWLVQRLEKLPYPVYVIPGNHDVPTIESLEHFAPMYAKFGYDDPQQLYYHREVLPGVRLIGLNSNLFDAEGKQLGEVDQAQLNWLDDLLANLRAANPEELILIAIHHNVLEHMPGQASNPLGKRYILSNADRLCQILSHYGVKLIFTGHLHVQDIAYSDRYDLYEITTGSMVSYPHPYRVFSYKQDQDGAELEVRSYRVKSVPGVPDLQDFSREWMGDRSGTFMLRLLTHPPLCLEHDLAEKLKPSLRYFWAKIADGDAQYSFPEFPPKARTFFEAFCDRPPADNDVTLTL
jgi:3',5'-cyclic AMP phosphodiesterase CpdA